MDLPSDSTASVDFGEASTAVVDYLHTAVPLRFWSVTRFDGERQVYLALNDSAYGFTAGDSHSWPDSMCHLMVQESLPNVAPAVDQTPAYAEARIRRTVPIGAYVGVPLLTTDGQLLGTLCGFDPIAQAPDLTQHEPLVKVLAHLLSTIMHADIKLTDVQRVAERLAQAAEIDVLTGLYNRRGWDRLLAHEDARYRRFGDTGTVIVVDLDNLKSVNDRYGHDAGDRHIRRAAQVIQESTRASDIIARLGGDEFGVVAANTSLEQAAVLVDRLAVNLQAAATPGSIGSASFTISSGLAGTWHNADQAMYRQKRRSRLEDQR